MKAAARKRIAAAVRASVPDLREKGRLLAVVPRGRILRGLYLEDSSDPERIYLWAFVQPLYAPASSITLDLGKRLGGASTTWSVADPGAIAAAARDEGAPFLAAVSSPEELTRWPFLDGRTDSYAREARAYSVVAAGRFIEGARALHDLARSVPGRTTWMVEMQMRAQQLAVLAETNPAGARDLLAKWEGETAEALRVRDLE